jgi:hypothetical protein
MAATKKAMARRKAQEKAAAAWKERKEQAAIRKEQAMDAAKRKAESKMQHRVTQAAKRQAKMDAAKQKAESRRQHQVTQKAKRQEYIDAISSDVRNDWMQIPLETKAHYGFKVRNSQVCFYYERKLCARPPDTLNMIARLLAAGVVESGADQVTVNHIPYHYPNKYVRKNHRHTSADPANQEHVNALADMLRRAEQI